MAAHARGVGLWLDCCGAQFRVLALAATLEKEGVAANASEAMATDARRPRTVAANAPFDDRRRGNPHLHSRGLVRLAGVDRKRPRWLCQRID
jgi:hypothetical protein